MKAVQINSFGGPGVIELNTEALVPEIKEGRIIVEVYAAGLNPIDYKIRNGNLKDSLKTFPVTLGTDFAGVIKETGTGDGGFKVGDEVYGNAIVLGGGSGTFAEVVSAKVTSTALKPRSLDFIEAASLPLAAASALQAIEEHIKIKRDHKILIQGGAGGIGSIAVQIAKMHGAFVAATSASENIEFVKELGADLVIDYKNEDFSEKISGYDAVFDTAGGAAAEKSLSVIKPGGIIVSMVAFFDQAKSKELGITAITQETKTTSDKLKRIADLVDKGLIKAEVDKVFGLGEVKEAFMYFETGHPQGKVVLRVK
jgi:alcohol dehydrogenase